MAEKLEDAFNTKLATRIVLGAVAVAVALITGLLWWGGATISETSVSQKLMAQQVGTLVETVNDLKARIEVGSVDRYTGSNAASDRAAFLASFTGAVQAQTAAFGDLIKSTNERVQAISIRQTEFDKTLKELIDFKARTEERLRMEAKQ